MCQYSIVEMYAYQFRKDTQGLDTKDEPFGPDILKKDPYPNTYEHEHTYKCICTKIVYIEYNTSHTCMHTHNITYRILIKVHMNLISKLLLYFRVLSQEESDKCESNTGGLVTSQHESDRFSYNLSGTESILGVPVTSINHELKKVLSLQDKDPMSTTNTLNYVQLSLTAMLLPSFLLISTIFMAASVSRGRVLMNPPNLISGDRYGVIFGKDTKINKNKLRVKQIHKLYSEHSHNQCT